VSPRPRKASDDDVTAAAMRVMQRVGPGELTLAAIAHEAGVTAAALVQRFGSRRALLVWLAEANAASAPDLGRIYRSRHATAIVALFEFAICFADMAPSPDALARSLAYLHNDLTDSVLRKHLVRQARGTRTSLVQLVKEARDAGELVPHTNVRALAQLLEAVMGGSLMAWATHREGNARARLRGDMRTVLAPYLTAKGRRRLGGR